MKLKVSVALEEALVERLDKIAAISHESRSQVIERMVRDQIMSAEQFANMMANPSVRSELLKQFNDPKVLGPMLRAMGEKPLSKKMGEKFVENAERFGVEMQKAKEKRGKKS